MAMVDPTKEVAAGMDEPKEPKITEMGYFYLSQQFINITQNIADIRKEISDLRNNIDIRFDNQRKETIDLRKEIDQKISDLRAEIKEDNRDLKQEIGNLRIWSIGTIVTIILATVGWFISK
ncbi:hypothetical protein [Thermoanaerobacterium sp. DL9XJH110]|uniref:hypothetical protein n=1 Tax=Thermoanaerobacterium sp. DL9XJH110 TaxID=3386643 RepID=UPI003BB6E5AD